MTIQPLIRLLLVEDNPGDARLVREDLADASGSQRFEFDHASSLAEGLNLVESPNTPDVVLLDLSLPDSFGLETLARWQLSFPALPVIVLTGSDDEALAVAAVREGAQDYLVKGRTDGGLLVHSIRYAIERKRVQEDLRQSKEDLEQRVQERTAELRDINRQLQTEIAERTHAQQQAAELLQRERLAREEVESVNRSKDEFLAMLSHELRTPLNAILGWSEILQSSETSAAEIREGIEVIERNARAQARLVEDVLEVSRIICGKIHLSVGSVDTAAVVDAALMSARPGASAKGVTLEQSVLRLPHSLAGDAIRLQQVVWNLISNAVKFTPAGGKVVVRTSQTERETVITVQDTGIGIHADFLPFVFDRFRQSDGSITRSYGGLGLGLSISKHLVDMHGGSISVSSPGLGQGSTFTVVLPTDSPLPSSSFLEKPPEKADKEVVPEDFSLGGIRVLAVDDEPDSRRVLTRQLTKHRMEVREASSVSQAMEILESWQPDLLISDIAMPGEDGYSLIRRLRASQQPLLQQLPAVALTAFARAEDRKRALDAGFHRHLPKPFDPESLASTVWSLLAKGGTKPAGFPVKE